MLHAVRRRQLADLGGGLDLQRGVADVEAVRELFADAVQEGVVAAAGPHQMRGQRRPLVLIAEMRRSCTSMTPSSPPT